MKKLLIVVLIIGLLGACYYLYSQKKLSGETSKQMSTSHLNGANTKTVSKKSEPDPQAKPLQKEVGDVRKDK